jgi:hypothetical protein
LQTELNDAWHNGTLAELTARLSDPNLLPLSHDVREAFLNQLAELNGSSSPPPKRQRPKTKRMRR